MSEYFTVDHVIKFGKRKVEYDDAEGIEKRIEGEILLTNNFDKLVLDLKKVKFMNAEVFEIINSCNAQLMDKGKGLIVQNPRGEVRSIFEDCYPDITMEYTEDEYVSEAIQKLVEKNSHKNISVKSIYK